MIYPHEGRDHQPPSDPVNLVIHLDLFYHFLSMFDPDHDPEYRILTQIALASGHTPDLNRLEAMRIANRQPQRTVVKQRKCRQHIVNLQIENSGQT
jgi:hypothetical protein